MGENTEDNDRKGGIKLKETQRQVERLTERKEKLRHREREQDKNEDFHGHHERDTKVEYSRGDRKEPEIQPVLTPREPRNLLPGNREPSRIGET